MDDRKESKKSVRLQKPKWFRAIILGDHFNTQADPTKNILEYRMLDSDIVVLRGRIQLIHPERMLARIDGVRINSDVQISGFSGYESIPLIIKPGGNLFLKIPGYERLHGRELVLNTVFSI